jgi:purine-cytosine permease-like protein
MDRDDDGEDSAGSDDSILPPGPRRSTYVPPADTTQLPAIFVDARASTPARSPTPDQAQDDSPDDAPEDPIDDDRLLAAFEAETAQLLTTPIVTLGTNRPATALSDLPAPSGPPVLFTEPEPEEQVPVATGRHSLATTPISTIGEEPPPIPRDWEPEVVPAVLPVGDEPAVSELPPPPASVEPFAAPPPVVYDLVEPARAAPVFDFDALRQPPVVPVVVAPVEEGPIAPPPADAEAAPFAPPGSPLAPPVDLVTAGAVPLVTDSRAVIAPPVDVESADEVDATDRAFDAVIVAPALDQPVTGSAPIQPVPSPRVPGHEVVLDDGRPVGPSPLAVEASGLEPTPVDRRVGRASRMFWLWFAANSSVLSVAFGAVILSLGMSLRQAAAATFLGTVVSFVPLGLTTLAGKWSGQPTMVISRATFGVVGNVVPAALAVITRVFWGAVLLWIVGIATAHILVTARLTGPFDETQLTAVVMVLGFLLAVTVAILGYALFARIQLVLTIVSALLVIGFVVITWHRVDIGIALTVPDGPWIPVVTGVVLVFSFVGLVWVNSGSELARYQRPSGSGGAAMIWGPLGTVIAPLILIVYGALLAASSPDISSGLLTDPLGTIAGMLPGWYPIPLIAATALSLLSGVVLTIYSGAFALQSVGLRVHRAVTAIIVGVLVLAVAILVSVSSIDVITVFRDLATTLAVPVAAWAGLVTAEMILRRRRFDSESLLRRGGVYPDANWVNLGAMIGASVIGFGLTTAAVGWLSWQGYLFRLFGADLGGDLAGTDLGVLVALALGLLTPFVAGVRTIRAQERVRLSPDRWTRAAGSAQN